MPNKQPNIKLADYTYELPHEKIAQFPLENRSASKLLVYKNGKVEHAQFDDIEAHIPKNSVLFFNDTKVIPARLHFQKETGAHVEIFLLNPETPVTDIALAMQQSSGCVWKCMVGNYKKWKSGQKLTAKIMIKDVAVSVTVAIENRANQSIKFTWNNAQAKFVDIIEAFGKVPLPPYINRAAKEADKLSYQTVYSKNNGAVAAPTAGLHFTNEVMATLKNKGCKFEYITLHVGAGTFQPIKENNILNHPMHREQICVSIDNINSLIHHKESIIATGTTSMRVLESLYWFGVDILTSNASELRISKLAPYQYNDADLPPRNESFKAIKIMMEECQLVEISGYTEIMIFPGYKFKVCDGLITNFHMPGATLILLIAAFIGKDWKKIYNEALNNEYRFLSYGDSSLLLP